MILVPFAPAAEKTATGLARRLQTLYVTTSRWETGEAFRPVWHVVQA
jgi:hypothetical protein